MVELPSMHLSFSPPLRSTTRLAAPAASAAHIVFRARLSLEDLAAAQRASTRVELWTDLPQAGPPRAAGEWAPAPFEAALAAGDGCPSSDAACALHLSRAPEPAPQQPGGSRASESDPEPAAAELTAAFTLPVFARASFAFTYRLVHASGDVRWLGDPDSNGHVEIVPEGEAFEEADGWTENDAGGRTYAVGQRTDSRDTVVGKINTDALQWTGWALRGTSIRRLSLPSPHDSGVSRASVLFLLPQPLHTHDFATLLPQPEIFYIKSETSSICITSAGTIILRGSGKDDLERSTYTSEPDRLAHVVSDTGFKFLSQSSDFLVVSPDAVYDGIPSKVYLLPLSTDTPPEGRQVRMKSAALAQLAPSSSCVSLFCPDTLSSVFIKFTDPEHELELVVGETGGKFVLSTVHNVSPDESWQLTFTAASARPQIVRAASVYALPTPPDSPHIERDARTISPPPASDDVPACVGHTSADPDGEKRGASESGAWTRTKAEVALRTRRPLSVLYSRPYLLAAFTLPALLLRLFFRRMLALLAYLLLTPARGASLRPGIGETVQGEERNDAPFEQTSLLEPSVLPQEDATQDTPVQNSVAKEGSDKTADSQKRQLNEPSTSTVTTGPSRLNLNLLENDNILRWEIPLANGRHGFILRSRHVQPNASHVQVRVDGRDTLPKVKELGDRMTLYEVETLPDSASAVNLEVRLTCL